MLNQNPLHRARYDANGNIILDDEKRALPKESPMKAKVTLHSDPRESRAKTPVWKTAQQKIKPSHVSPKESKTLQAEQADKEHTEKPEKQSLLVKAAKEGKQQIRETQAEVSIAIAAAELSLTSSAKRGRGMMRSLWKTAKKPMTFKRKNLKKRSPLVAFGIDTVKFGGTFAGIFITLFTIINYQSFWQIAAAELAIGNDLETQDALESMGREKVSSGAKGETSAFAKQGSLIAYLPEVGPFEDRLVIPKIGKNLPIVRPSMDGLRQENWPQFEEDIQEALKDGVVHYPGSARPGQPGNSFFTAHSSYYAWIKSDYKDAFARLHELVVGDTYFVYYGGDKHVYKIIERKEVKPTNVSVLDQPVDRLLSTLMTCTPLGTTLRRLVLIAEEIDPSTGIALNVGERAEKINTAHFKNIEALPI